MGADNGTTFQSDTHRYRVVEPLGQGGQGQTLLVEREGEPGSRYVLKLLRLEHVEAWKQVELFEREVTTLAALEHPGIPKLVDRIVEDGRTSGIVQTWIEGHTLAVRIAERRPLDPDRFEAALREGLEILAYLQQRVPPVLHRDINPRNVMLGEDRLYLIDFGAVRVGGKTDMTSVGTFGYMAPEQVLGRPQPASDTYGLGMTFVCLAEARDVDDLPIDPATGQVDPKQLLPTMTPRIREVLLSMIRPGLAERLGDPRQALRQLDAPVESRPSTPIADAPEKPVTTAARRNALLIASGVMALGVAGFFVGTVGSEQPVPTPAPVAPAPAPAPEPPMRAEPSPSTPARAAPPSTPSVEEPSSPPPAREVPATLDDTNSAVLTLKSNPPGLSVSIDGRATCVTPCSAQVAYGKRRVVIEYEGQQVERVVNVLEDTALTLDL